MHCFDLCVASACALLQQSGLFSACHTNINFDIGEIYDGFYTGIETDNISSARNCRSEVLPYASNFAGNVMLSIYYCRLVNVRLSLTQWYEI